MDFRILGPLEVLDEGRSLAIPAGHQRTLLVLLLLNANRVVGQDRIVEAIWGEQVPATGTKALAYHVSQLRDALAPGRRPGATDGPLVTEPSGYVIRVEPEAIDAVRFERLVRQGHELLAADPAAARAPLLAALDLWRGDPLADVAYADFAQAEIRRLEEVRLGALEDRLEADLAMGRHAAVVGELGDLVRAHPLRERLRGLLMLALYRAGRQAEALRVAGQGRRLLSEELGIDPSPDLAQLESWIVGQDPRLDATPAPEGPVAAGRARNPYKGLRAFGEADREDFFGREALVERLVARLGEVARDGRLLVVVGPSGSGKSSVVRAGLVPAVRDGALEGSDRWLVATMSPGAAPFAELAAALRDAPAPVPAAAIERAERQGDLRPVVRAVAGGDAPRLLLVVDQLEELYVRTGPEGRETFLRALLAALGDPGTPLVVVATLRADCFHLPIASADVGDLVRRGVEVVTPLTRGELVRAIELPARGVGAVVEAGLAGEVAAELERQGSPLPLLQFTLMDLFERSDGRRLGRDAYDATGGVMAALGRRADEAWSALDADGRAVARQVLLRLVEVTEGGAARARRASRADLGTLGDAACVEVVLDELGRRRLLTFDRDPVSGEPSVEVAHEALLRHWPRLAAWIDDLRQDLWVRRRLDDAAAEWEAAGRSPGFLAAGSRLDQLRAWAASTRLRLSDAEAAFLEASEAERRRARRRNRRLQTGVGLGLAAAVLVVGGLSAMLLVEQQAAGERREIASARELAAGSIASLGDPQLAVLLALRAAAATAARGYVVDAAYDALHWALQDAQVPYPPGASPFTVRQGPSGPRGQVLLPPDELMRAAAAYVDRPLTSAECRTYAHADACPEVAAPSGLAEPLRVRTSAGISAVAALAAPSLAGTQVRVLSELPDGGAALATSAVAGAGIDVVTETGVEGDLVRRATAGDLPDIAIVTRPADVAVGAGGGWLLDLDGLADTSAVRLGAGPYAVSLVTAPGVDGRPHLFGAPLAATVEDLLWFPVAAVRGAGYPPPSSPAALRQLVASLRQDRRVPWCLGTEAGDATGSAAARWVEDTLLDTTGIATYDRWVAGSLPFYSPEVRGAFSSFGSLVLAGGAVLNGPASAGRTPEAIAALGMQLDPPACWLYHGTSADHPRMQEARGQATAVPYPGAETAPHPVLGRLYTVVVLHDRPEVRQVVEALLGAGTAEAIAAAAPERGIHPVVETGADAGTAEARRLRAALADGTFRVRATDLLPAEVRTAFLAGIQRFVADYEEAALARLDLALLEADDAWARLRDEAGRGDGPRSALAVAKADPHPAR